MQRAVPGKLAFLTLMERGFETSGQCLDQHGKVFARSSAKAKSLRLKDPCRRVHGYSLDCFHSLPDCSYRSRSCRRCSRWVQNSYRTGINLKPPHSPERRTGEVFDDSSSSSSRLRNSCSSGMGRLCEETFAEI